MIYYQQIDLRTLLFEAACLNSTALRYLLFTDRFKRNLTNLFYFLLCVFFFLDVAIKFKLSSLDPLSVPPSNPSLLKEYSIFETYIYVDRKRAFIHRLCLESGFKLVGALAGLWLFYRYTHRQSYEDIIK